MVYIFGLVNAVMKMGSRQGLGHSEYEGLTVNSVEGEKLQTAVLRTGINEDPVTRATSSELKKALGIRAAQLTYPSLA